MDKKILLLFAFGLMLIPFISGVEECENPGIPPQPLGGTFDLIQTCDVCTFTNLSSVTTPNSTIIFNQAMTKNGTTYNFTFSQADSLGIYYYSVIGDKINPLSEETMCFVVTPFGKISSTPESLLYVALIIVMFGITIALMYFIIVLPLSNPRDENDSIIGISLFKYLKVFFIGVIYPIIIVLLNLMNGLATQFTSLSIFAGTIGFFYEMLLRIAWPYTFIIIVWIIILVIKDVNFKKILKFRRIT